jgi:hypothetical protein
MQFWLMIDDESKLRLLYNSIDNMKKASSTKSYIPYRYNINNRKKNIHVISRKFFYLIECDRRFLDSSLIYSIQMYSYNKKTTFSFCLFTISIEYE